MLGDIHFEWLEQHILLKYFIPYNEHLLVVFRKTNIYLKNLCFKIYASKFITFVNFFHTIDAYLHINNGIKSNKFLKRLLELVIDFVECTFRIWNLIICVINIYWQDSGKKTSLCVKWNFYTNNFTGIIQVYLIHTNFTDLFCWESILWTSSTKQLKAMLS